MGDMNPCCVFISKAADMIPSFFKKNRKNEQDNKAMEQYISKVWKDLKENPEPWNPESMGAENIAREKVLNRVLASINVTETKPVFNFRKFAAIAAAAVLIAAVAVGFLFRDELLDQLITYPQIIVETRQGEQEKVTLPDGSVVTLNAGTKLSYPQQFKRQSRKVTLLEGEAFFDVKHDEKIPFQVEAGKTFTHVLGTAFNINAYSWLKTINITVTSGKVAVNNEMLLPNQQIVYDKASATLEKKKLLASNMISWMQGGLAFNDADFKTVAAVLERKYNVMISFSDEKIEDFHFSATFEPTDKLIDILDALTMTQGLVYEINQNKITIKN